MELTAANQQLHGYAGARFCQEIAAAIGATSASIPAGAGDCSALARVRSSPSGLKPPVPLA